jgi:hypothetical protein
LIDWNWSARLIGGVEPKTFDGKQSIGLWRLWLGKLYFFTHSGEVGFDHDDIQMPLCLVS